MEDEQSFLADFRQESNEGLETVEQLLLVMERGDQEAINAVFRAIHSIKGGAGFLNLGDIRSLAHELEHLLDLIRSGRKSPDSQVTDLMLGSVDLLRSLINGQGGVTTAQIEHQIALTRAQHDPAAAAPVPRPAAPVPRPAAPAARARPATACSERFGRFLIAQGWLDSEQVLSALIAQDWAALKPINVLRDQLGLDAAVCLDVLEQAEESGACCFTVAERLGLLQSRSLADLRDLIRASRPALGQIIVQLGYADARSIREWLREFMLQRSRPACAPSQEG